LDLSLRAVARPRRVSHCLPRALLAPSRHLEQPLALHACISVL
jgi:hypothetical protein